MIILPSRLVAALLFGLAFLTTATDSRAQPQCAPVALFETVQNSVQLIHSSTKTAATAVRRTTVCVGDTIRVGDKSRAVIVMLASNTVLAIEQNSAFVIAPPPAAGGGLIDLMRGALFFITRRGMSVRTPFVTAAVEGTEFVVRVRPDRAEITVFDGAVRARNDLGDVVVGAGEQAVAVQGQPPQLQIVVRPRDAVQWAIHYQPVLPLESLEQLALVPDSARDARFFVRRAAVSLSVGQLDDARSDLDEAERLDPSLGDALVLRTVVAVALNDRAGALQTGRLAVQRASASAAAHLALSYALQANLDLDGASEAASRAVAIAPEDGDAWARLAELRLALGDPGRAVSAARQAAVLAPGASRAYSTLGFAAAARGDLAEAREAFDRAVSLQPDAPLARLGLGLVTVQQGRLEDGRRELEVAAALDPNNSLLRSYLGKAYADERRSPLAEEQFVLAKQLDSLDPTPFLYDAILKHALNRPVEALLDLEESIARNDNRAVYRSRLSLDEDAAARGSRLGRIYRDLGFEQRALLEGWQSLARDPASHSAHRLLADSYLVLPGHTIARDSELLQAQLLQPLNINPVQPRLAENGLVFLDQTGIATPGFNEYSRLFAANGIRVVSDVIAGGENTFADNVIASALYDRVSMSVGQSRIDTDGFRANNDQTLNVYNAFAQVNLGYDTSVQVETRFTDHTLGDREVRFFPSAFLPDARFTGDTRSIRGGLRQRLGRRSLLLASYVHRTADLDSTFNALLRASRDRADFAEVRHLHRIAGVSLSSGFGHYDGSVNEAMTFAGRALPPSLRNVSHTNAYLYSESTHFDALSVTAGVSVDAFDNGLVPRKQANPKLGVTWHITPRTMLRGAAFRTLKRTLISSQTIEPTHVAGFNQFFDDPNGTDAWRIGLGLDRVVGRGFYAGAEIGYRDLTVPIRTLTTSFVAPQQNVQLRAYSYRTFGDTLAASAHYIFDRFLDSGGMNGSMMADSESHRTQLELRTFRRSGLFGLARLTYGRQHGRFADPTGAIVPGRGNFWVVDGSAGYRFGNQRGTLAVDVRNLFDQQFQFQEGNAANSMLARKRLVLGRVTVAF